MHTRTAHNVRRAASAAAVLFLTAACSSGAKDAARTDTAAATATAAQSGTSVPSPNLGAATDGAAAVPGTSSGTIGASAMIDPDAASKEQLTAIPGMTAAAADALIAGRPYSDMVSVDKALAKSLTSADARKQVYAKLWKPIDLNTAKGEEILLIPGVGPRMRHEFEEYRPYKNIEQFRREIGKYVDKNEVARLEQYVTIR